MIKEFNKRRASFQSATAIGLPIVVVLGWVYPALGFFLLLCMAGSLVYAAKNGRQWCDWTCPRGSFYDLYLKKISKGRDIPAFMRSMPFRAGVLTLLITALSVQVYMAWGDWRAVGFAMVRVLTVTTSAGIVLGAFYNERAWCHICPMGTLSRTFQRSEKSLVVSDDCRSCGLCSKACPMRLQPHEYKSGVMDDPDCIKCSTCVAACPKKAINFEDNMATKAA